MEIIFDPIFLQHIQDGHPENRLRLSRFEGLTERRVIDAKEYLRLVHTEAHIRELKAACTNQYWLDPDTPLLPDSFQVACKAVGATLAAVQENSFALVRPPGHHAYPDHGSGFCLFNNIAIAVQDLIRQGKRVLIFDFDGHFGDGTSHIFYQTDQVLYWSTHQFPAFPGTGWYTEIGAGKGRGFNLNIPLPPMSGDDILMDAIESTLGYAKAFQPDVVAVSAGFDGHQLDPLLDLRFSSTSFYKIGTLLRDSFSNIFAVLEGGYNVEELPKGVHNFVAGINGLPVPYFEPETESPRRAWETYEMTLHSLLALFKHQI